MSALRWLVALTTTVVLVGTASAQRVVVPHIAPVVVTPIVPIPQLPRGLTPFPSAPRLQTDGLRPHELAPTPQFRSNDSAPSGPQANAGQTSLPQVSHTCRAGGPDGDKPRSEGDDGKDEKGRDWSWLKWLIAALIGYALLRRQD